MGVVKECTCDRIYEGGPAILCNLQQSSRQQYDVDVDNGGKANSSRAVNCAARVLHEHNY